MQQAESQSTPLAATPATPRLAPWRRERAALCAWIAGLTACGVALAWWTWGRTLDVLIDYGGELYVAWRLREGDVLYRDLAYFTGPVSPYFNALCMRVFGTGISTLAGVNLVWIAAIAALLFAGIARLGGLLAAGGATLLFLSLSAFGHLSPYGTYNFVTPYSHETVHGTLLALCALVCLARWLERPSPGWLSAIGVALGLVALTKPEYLLATGVALASGLIAGAWSHRVALPRVLMGAAVFCATSVLPGLVAWGLLATAMPAGEALRGTLGSWPHMLDSQVAELPFYRSILGLDRLGENLGAMALAAGGLLVLCAVALGAALLVPRNLAARRVSALVALVLVAGLLYFAIETPALAPPDAGFERAKAWLELARPLPLVALAGAIACLARLVANGRKGSAGARMTLGLAWCVFALALQAKILFNVHLEHYGYALAMPALTVLALVLLGWLPQWAATRGGSGAVCAAAGAGLFVAMLAALFPLQRRNLSWQHIAMGQGGDAFLADERGIFVEQVLRALEERHGAAQSVLVLPEGAMINYLARKPMPARHLSYMPPELLMFGEEAMLAALRAQPPEVIVLVQRVTAEYGTPLFGPDYGRRLAQWVQREYVAAGPPFGDPPLTPQTRFGAQILVRRPQAPSGR